uniref:SEA domain-containing protein n=1 Tax=Anas zonorhyncha TaxID=75864 RepID=A0A8B9UI82_9AVES
FLPNVQLPEELAILVHSIEAATYKTPLNSGKENFRLKFRISNLPYSPELQDSRSQMYQEISQGCMSFFTIYLQIHL